MSVDTFEFFGPVGTGILTIVLPLVCYALYFGCNSHSCLQLYPELQLPQLPSSFELFSLEALAIWLGWLALIIVLHLVLPAKTVQGVVLPDGKRLTYRLNAFLVLVIVYGAAVIGFVTDLLPLGWVADNILQLTTASILVSFLLAVYLYASSFRKGAMLNSHGTSGYFTYDFWMGRELNPRIGSLDLKEFCELYPGMILWGVLNLAYAYKQRQRLGYITNSMYMVNAFELMYIVDGLWNEPAILTTMDITTDGFGFMLAFGDLSWVPLLFSLQARFLVDYPQDLSWGAVAGILAMNMLGLYIFRGANNQKDQFRRDPNHPSVKHLKTLKTERGTQLICSSWWGAARHINYFGDWIMGLSWCLPTGIRGAAAVVPFFYTIYFATLLIHRERRDELGCRKKYGKDWDKYCSMVRSRIVPYVY